jgi:hypothetical protein
MTYETMRRRRALLTAVLDRLPTPSGPRPDQRRAGTRADCAEAALSAVPGARTEFRDLDGLLDAAGYRWLTLLTGRLELAGTGTPAGPNAVAVAWRTLAREQPRLRALLDALADRPAARSIADAEHRMLALYGGLAELGEPDEQVILMGGRFAEMLGLGPAPVSITAGR